MRSCAGQKEYGGRHGCRECGIYVLTVPDHSRNLPRDGISVSFSGPAILLSAARIF